MRLCVSVTSAGIVFSVHFTTHTLCTLHTHTITIGQVRPLKCWALLGVVFFHKFYLQSLPSSLLVANGRSNGEQPTGWLSVLEELAMQVWTKVGAYQCRAQARQMEEKKKQVMCHDSNWHCVLDFDLPFYIQHNNED